MKANRGEKADPPSFLELRAYSTRQLLSKKLHLARVALRIDQRRARRFGYGEAQRIEPVADLVEAEPLRRRLEACAEQLRDRALALHAQAELGLVERAAAHLADQRQHPLGAVGPVGAQPFVEQVLDLERQAQDRETRARGA